MKWLGQNKDHCPFFCVWVFPSLRSGRQKQMWKQQPFNFVRLLNFLLLQRKGDLGTQEPIRRASPSLTQQGVIDIVSTQRRDLCVWSWKVNHAAFSAAGASHEEDDSAGHRDFLWARTEMKSVFYHAQVKPKIHPECCMKKTWILGKLGKKTS